MRPDRYDNRGKETEMKELVFIGIAVLAAIAAFFLIAKKSGADCIP